MNTITDNTAPLLAGKVALITGACCAIGQATVSRFLAEGAQLALTDTADQADQNHRAQFYQQADLSQEQQVVELIKAVQARFGRLDILINIAGGDFSLQAAQWTSSELIAKTMDVNLKSSLLCCREAIKVMKAQGSGAIVNMSSMTYRGSEGQWVYSAAKGAVATLSKSLAQAVGRYGIRVNAVAPALIEVDRHKALLGEEAYQQLKQTVAARYPLGRLGLPEDVAGCITFLASDQAAFITNQVLEVSGGARL